ncbi:DMSO/TMAO reductase YedYZ molybdopterin-dependent catalytic subunit [Paenibacillus shirakamiensis]|uniref:DMSO/TMAO reductase YedYZ molybdopterin-dependent catalytic subunit n=1 Tax=Paenibacillus shirakamiensis TaxID=1265935 RepID=A0ABS4JJ56_9BACL|nr:molybdopterin-dependent oxidoreductase [Paenibacillus shirakamiensis]MBP2001732.1 DMSO/TMAO reductase YedYZ molybdopterin-dependent catalytic subunit [Paenibacillus shirakamiensis]
MSAWLKQLRKGYGKKLVSLHAWNAWMVLFLSISGLILISGYWREILGAIRVWIKWLHIGVGIALLVPVIYYLALAAKHWKQLKDRPAQKGNVIVVLSLLTGWLLSGVLLWLHRYIQPSWANGALVVHDLLTWVGLPFIIYHSLTRTKWLKEPHRRALPVEKKLDPDDTLDELRPLYGRRSFLKGSIAVVLAVILGPSFFRWIGRSLGGGTSVDELVQKDANRLIPAPTPLPASSPPRGGGSKGDFRVYTVTEIPAFNNQTWSFELDGLVNHKLTWGWEEFVKLGRNVQVSDFHCVTGWSVYNNTWEGIPLKTLLTLAGVKADATFVKFYSGDEVYTDSLTLQQAQMDDVMVAVMHDGKPIPNELGGPVRLIVPRMYAYKSVKWLNRIELIAQDHIGYWEERGYDKDAWVPGENKTKPMNT